jgi:hypothetical protein
MRSILALALLCAATMKASAQYPNGYFVDGNALMAWCEPHNATGPSNALCIGYVAGVSDAVNFSRQFTGQGPNTSCTPSGVTTFRKRTWCSVTCTTIQTNAILRLPPW